MTPLDETSQVKLLNGVVSVENNARINTQIQYYDGLGRPNQLVQYGFSPQGRDIITLNEYDSFGRDSIKWLPLTSSLQKNMGYRKVDDIYSELKSLYGNDEKPYSYPLYQNSPLNRTIEQYAPGKEWYDNKKSVRTNYLSNVKSGNSSLICGLYSLSGNMLYKNGNYETDQLYVTELKDEDGNTSYEFKDKLARVILTRQINSNENYDTYYVYDNFGNLVIVIPPMLSKTWASSSTAAVSISSTAIQQYSYLYEYDNRKRCVKKKLPGCDWIFYIYDKGDRLVLTQDGEMRKTNNWAFNKYDGLDRNIISGIITDIRDHSTLRKLYEAQHSVEEIDKQNRITNNSPVYSYSNDMLPTLNLSDIKMVSYYDKYDDILNQSHGGKSLANWGLVYKIKTGYNTMYNKSTKGLLVGVIEFLEDSVDNSLLATIYYYDERGQIIQTQNYSHLGTLDFEYTAYDFSGQPTSMIIEHGLKTPLKVMDAGNTNTLQTLIETFTYGYDHTGRPLTTSLNGTIIRQNKYNELGFLEEKKQKNLLSSTYKYNIRGWITSLQEETTMLKQELKYSEAGLYNGNIASLRTSYNDKISTDLSYIYDNLNQLKNASGTDELGKAVSERVVYDMHGNIKTFRRIQEGKTIANMNVSHAGNQMTSLSGDSSTEPRMNQYPATTSSFVYNKNGSLVKDTGRGIMKIEYNYLNLPKLIQFKNGNQTHYTYSTSGQKLRTKHIISIVPTDQPIVGEDRIWNIPVDSIAKVIVTDYVGNMVYEKETTSSSLAKIKIYYEDGYNAYDPITSTTHKKDYYCYLKDYIGNNRDVVHPTTRIEQRTEYYPFGAPMAQKIGSAGTQPYKYSGKELDLMHGLNYYDFHARHYDPLLMRFTTMDPLAEQMPWDSPYAYCGNNPINRVDKNGKIWSNILGGGFGALVEYGSQVASNIVDNRGVSLQAFTENIDLAGIAIAAGEGALTSGGSAIKSVAAKASIKVVSSIAKNAVHVTIENGIVIEKNIKKIAKNTTIDIAGDMVGKIAPKGKVKIPETSGNKQLVAARQKAGSRKLTSTEANKARNSAKSKNNERKAVAEEINSSGQKVAGGVTSTATKNQTNKKEDEK